MSKPANLLQGTLDMLVLKLLSQQPLHGLAIKQRLQTSSSEVLDVGDSALYPALQKLLDMGHVRASWVVTDNGRRAKSYSITAQGRIRLRHEIASWERLSSAISSIVSVREDRQSQ